MRIEHPQLRAGFCTSLQRGSDYCATAPARLRPCCRPTMSTGPSSSCERLARKDVRTVFIYTDVKPHMPPYRDRYYELVGAGSRHADRSISWRGDHHPRSRARSDAGSDRAFLRRRADPRQRVHLRRHLRSPSPSSLSASTISGCPGSCSARSFRGRERSSAVKKPSRSICSGLARLSWTTSSPTAPSMSQARRRSCGARTSPIRATPSPTATEVTVLANVDDETKAKVVGLTAPASSTSTCPRRRGRQRSRGATGGTGKFRHGCGSIPPSPLGTSIFERDSPGLSGISGIPRDKHPGAGRDPARIAERPSRFACSRSAWRDDGASGPSRAAHHGPG